MKNTTKGILGTLAAFFASWSIGKELGRKFGRTTYTTKRSYGHKFADRYKKDQFFYTQIIFQPEPSQSPNFV